MVLIVIKEESDNFHEITVFSQMFVEISLQTNDLIATLQTKL